jgi:hypothetical protein
MKVKGNVYKNKRVLIESIFKAKAEQARDKLVEEQAAAHRSKNKAARLRRIGKQQERLRLQAGGLAAEADVKIEDVEKAQQEEKAKVAAEKKATAAAKKDKAPAEKKAAKKTGK